MLKFCQYKYAFPQDFAKNHWKLLGYVLLVMREKNSTALFNSRQLFGGSAQKDNFALKFCSVRTNGVLLVGLALFHCIFWLNDWLKLWGRLGGFTSKILHARYVTKMSRMHLDLQRNIGSWVGKTIMKTFRTQCIRRLS